MMLVLCVPIYNPSSLFAQNLKCYTYSNDQGLASNLTKSIIQDTDGLIWIATESGLVWYNGREFNTLNTNLPSNIVKDLIKLQNKKILLVTDSGIGVIEKKSDQFVYEPIMEGSDTLQKSKLYLPKSVYQDAKLSLWISEPGAISRLSNNVFKRFKLNTEFAIKPDDSRTFQFVEDKFNRLLVSTIDGRMLYYDPLSAAFRVLPLKPPTSDFQINALLKSKDNRVFAGSNEGLYELLLDENLLKASWKKHVAIDDVSSMIENEDGKMFIGSWYSGLYRWDPDQAGSTAEKITSLPFNVINNLAFDKNKSLWVASDEGVAIVQKTYFDPFPLQTRNLFTRSVSSAQNGDILVVQHDGVFRIKTTKKGQFNAKKVYGRSTGRFYKPTGDTQGTWISTRPGALSYISNEGINTTWLGNINWKYRRFWPNKMILDDYGNLWCYQVNRVLLKLTPKGKLEVYNKEKGVETSVNIIKKGPTGKIYLGGNDTNGYLYEYDQITGSFLNLSIKPPIDQSTPFIVHDLDIDQTGRIWLGTSQGLFVYFQDRIVRDSITDIIGKPVIKALEIDQFDRIWLGTEQGLLLYTEGSVTRFTKTDGLPGSSIVHRSLAFDKNNRLWVGTSNGLSYWQFPIEKIQKTPKPILTSFKVDGFEKMPGTLQDGDYKNNASLDVSFLALSYPGENIQYQSRIKGLQAEWSLPTSQTKLVMPPLPAGNYVLQLRAQQSGHLWSEPTEVRFSIASPWYARSWMVIFYLIILSGAIYFLKKFRNTLKEKVKADEERQKLVSLIELSSECIMMVSLKGRVSFMNAAGHWLLGIEAEDEDFQQKQSLDNRRVFEFIHEEDVLFFKRIVVPSVISQGQWSGELHLQHVKTKQQIPVLCSAFTIKNLTTGKPMAFAAINSDITIRKKVERELIEAREEALKAAQTKAEFLANMSHEIRTPMNAVIGMTGLMLETKLNHEQREYIETIRTSGDALLTVINDILDFSKIESGKLELEQYPFNLRLAVEESIDIFAAKALEKNLELVYYIHDGVPVKVSGDVTRLRQILVNLVSNAIKFTKEGEIVVEVKVDQSYEEKIKLRSGKPGFGNDLDFESSKVALQFSVQDTGIGIPEDRIDRIFNSFSQADASTTRKYGGTGLGLTISKHLSELMNGSMWVESEYGQGSTFLFTVLTDKIAEPKSDVSNKLAGKRALIVDDNATNRRILSMQAASWGMESHAVSSAKDALKLINSDERFDIAILDFHMPEMDGLMLATEMRRNQKSMDLPIIMLTSAGNREMVTETVGVNLAAYLNKPVKQSQLFDILVSIFEKGHTGPLAHFGKPYPESDVTKSEPLPLRILVAEDNAVNQKLVIKILEKIGYSADVAANGLEAIEAVKQISYDLILMDVQMPEMDGLEATRNICQNMPRKERPFIIAMTAL
jgi:signal transduction histidine kinase/ligand-binding sensor domain-containing protein/DNA-binding response OmpR family regulator